MLMITRTQSTIELGLRDERRLAIDVARIAGAMLVAERGPCGRVCHALLLHPADGAAPIRIEGSARELTELHQIVVETMAEAATHGPVH